MKKFHLGYILAFFAAALALSAAYISVIGWGKLFAGSAFVVMVVMAIIEIAKVMTTIYLHKYGKRTRVGKEPKNMFVRFFKRIFSLNTYLAIAVIATMMLTSVGIYGFLTNAYQETANKMELQDGEVSILEGKKLIFEDKITSNSEVSDSKTKRIDQLSDLRGQQETRLDSLIANNHWINVNRTRQDIATANEEIQKLTFDIDELNISNSALSDSVSFYQVSILEMKAGSDIAGEVGPLKYISTLTGRPMDNIINYLVLIIIFIFDPMAISLVLATNKVFEVRKRESETENKELTVPDPIVVPVAPTVAPIVAPVESQEDIDKRNKIIEAINNTDPDILDFSYDLPEEKNDEVVEYVESENGDFNKTEPSEDIKSLIKNIDSNPVYIQLLDVLFLEGDRKEGDIIPPYKVLVKDINNKGIKCSDKVIKNFLTVCNMLHITNMKNKDSVKIEKDYVTSQSIISLVSK